MPFRFNAKNLFATYPQAEGLTTERVVRFYKEELKCSEYTVGRELHADGHIHYHCLVRWDQPFETRNERMFDIDGRHPNIQTARSPQAIYTYVTKDGDFQSNRREENQNPKSKYSELLECPDVETFWTTVKRKFPQDYVLRLDKLEYMASKHFKPTIEEYISPFTDFVVTPEIQRWLSEEFPKVKFIRLRSWLGDQVVPHTPPLQN